MVSGLDQVPDVAPLPVTPTYSARERMRRWTRRSEGRLSLILAVLVLLGIAAAFLGALGVRSRVDLLDGVTGGSGLRAARELYVSLADADTTSTSAFLADGASPDELGRYRRDIASATAALTVVAAR